MALRVSVEPPSVQINTVKHRASQGNTAAVVVGEK